MVPYAQYDILRNSKSKREGNILPSNITKSEANNNGVTPIQIGYESQPMNSFNKVEKTAKKRDSITETVVTMPKHKTHTGLDKIESNQFSPGKQKSQSDINLIHDQNKEDLRSLIHRMNNEAIKKRNYGRRSQRKASRSKSSLKQRRERRSSKPKALKSNRYKDRDMNRYKDNYLHEHNENMDNDVTRKTTEILKDLDIEKPHTIEAAGFKYLPLKKKKTDRANIMNGNLDNFKT